MSIVSFPRPHGKAATEFPQKRLPGFLPLPPPPNPVIHRQSVAKEKDGQTEDKSQRLAQELYHKTQYLNIHFFNILLM